jgi:hypothetical protein
MEWIVFFRNWIHEGLSMIRRPQSYFSFNTIHSHEEWLVFPELSHRLAAIAHQIAALKNGEQVAESADRDAFIEI